MEILFSSVLVLLYLDQAIRLDCSLSLSLRKLARLTYKLSYALWMNLKEVWYTSCLTSNQLYSSGTESFLSLIWAMSFQISTIHGFSQPDIPDTLFDIQLPFRLYYHSPYTFDVYLLRGRISSTGLRVRPLSAFYRHLPCYVRGWNADVIGSWAFLEVVQAPPEWRDRQDITGTIVGENDEKDAPDTFH